VVGRRPRPYYRERGKASLHICASSTAGCFATRRHAGKAHGILVSLITVVCARAGIPTLPSVVPGGDARNQPIVLLDIGRVGNELVVALGREVDGGCCDSQRSERQEGPARSAERPREVEVPAIPESLVVVEEEGHNCHASALHGSAESQNTHCNLPSRGSALDAARHDDDERHDCAQLDDDAERDEEAYRPPHVAERGVLGAVAHARKG